MMIEIIPNWHPIFVHFTIALLLLSVTLYVVTLFVNQPLAGQWLIVARWSLWFGAAISVLTLAAGLHAFNTVSHDDPSHAAMIEHRNWALATLGVFFVLAIWSALRVRTGREVGKLFIPAMLIGGLLLISTAWHGAELVYRHGLGVMSLPKVSDHSHEEDHNHRESVEDGHHAEHDDHNHDH